jgi:hypothetical protein
MTWQVWIRLNPYQTTQVIINANSAWECKAIAEAQYGQGNVLNYTQING